MDGLLQKILQLPNLEGTEEDFRRLEEIISAYDKNHSLNNKNKPDHANENFNSYVMKEKCGDEFFLVCVGKKYITNVSSKEKTFLHKGFNVEITMHEKFLFDAICYLDEWNKMIEEVSRWTRIYEAAWHARFPAKAIAGDDLLELTILFLPKDVSLLKLILEKLSNALKFEYGTYNYYFLTNLTIAITYEISRLEPQLADAAVLKTEPGAKISEKPLVISPDVQEVANDIRDQVRVNDIIAKYEAAKSAIEDLIWEKIRAKNKLVNQYYQTIRLRCGSDEAIHIIIKDSYMEDSFLHVNPEICFISKKYYTICSLLEVLKYGKTNTEKLESFATAYNGYAKFVLENADYNVGKKGSNGSNPPQLVDQIKWFFGWQLKEGMAGNPGGKTKEEVSATPPAPPVAPPQQPVSSKPAFPPSVSASAAASQPIAPDVSQPNAATTTPPVQPVNITTPDTQPAMVPKLLP